MATYKIMSAQTGTYLALDTTATTLSNNINVKLEDWQDIAHKKWMISSFANGSYIRTPVDKSYGLNVYRSGSPYNCDIHLISGNETDAKVNFINSGNFMKIKLTNYNLYLTVGSSGDNVYWASNTSAANQLWSFTQVSSMLQYPIDDYFYVSQGYSAASGHYGVDYSASEGTPIKAAINGTVLYMQNYPYNLDSSTVDDSDWNTMGNAMYIKYPTGLAVYMHMRDNPANYHYIGKEINQGDIIGYVGNTGASTGPHLHFGYQLGARFTENSASAYNQGTKVNHIHYF